MATARESIQQFQLVMAEIVTEANRPTADQLSRLLGPTGADGKWGRHTLAVMNDLQASFALPATALPNAELFAAINAYRATSGGLTPLPDLSRLLADIAAYKAEKAAEAAAGTPDATDPEPAPADGTMALYQEPPKQGWEWWKWALAITGGVAAVGIVGYCVYRFIYLPSQEETHHARSLGDPDPDPDGGRRFGASDFVWGE